MLLQGNILIDDSGIPKICDFGLARIFLEQASTGLTTTSEHTGTARYLAPELVASDTTVYPTLASDVYALGCLGLDVSIKLYLLPLCQ
jgi:serine/threonine protein kinase